jgi:Zn-dependent metalloprotease
VHYGNAYDNAFWDGSQMIFGDAQRGVQPLHVSIDVVGHELTHGITDHPRPRVPRPVGALNESVSDVFGSLIKQYVLKQTANEADWLIGEGLLTFQGQSLRSMKAPGTAYDDPQLGGKDPQPATMAGYVTTDDDNGGVHLNSGIPNHASTARSPSAATPGRRPARSCCHAGRSEAEVDGHVRHLRQPHAGQRPDAVRRGCQGQGQVGVERAGVRTTG